MRRARVTEAYVASLAERLSERDLDLVASLERLRVATGVQLRRLHFTQGTEAANARQAYRRLRSLCEARVLTELERRVGGPTGGSAQAVFALDTAGQRLASASGPAGGVRLRRPWSPGAPFLAHTLAVSELYVGLVKRARESGGELAAFDAEPACWRRFTGPGGAGCWLKPDAFVRWLSADYEHAFFVEVDRATASRSTVARKLAVYRRYWQSGTEQRRRGLFPKVLVLVPSDARRTALVDAAGSLPAESWPLYRVAHYEDGLTVLSGGQP